MWCIGSMWSMCNYMVLYCVVDTFRHFTIYTRYKTFSEKANRFVGNGGIKRNK